MSAIVTQLNYDVMPGNYSVLKRWQYSVFNAAFMAFTVRMSTCNDFDDRSML